MAALQIADLQCPELERDIRLSLNGAPGCHARRYGDAPSPEDAFAEEMADVTQGIERRGRFGLLKRFIARGSLLPSWENRFQNSKGALDDHELAVCVDFVSGHMVTKFQGKLAELLAAGPVADLTRTLAAEGRIPAGGSLVSGGAIRCMPSFRATPSAPDAILVGVEGPDAVYLDGSTDGRAGVHLVAEVKSYYVPPSGLRKQCDGHLRALGRGAHIRGSWYPSGNVVLPQGAPVRVYVRPSGDWHLTRNFSLVPDERGTEQVVMDEQPLPGAVTTSHLIGDDEWTIKLAWSHDALRAAAFLLMHRYMGQVGKALAADPGESVRQDMEPSEAGENDFLAQLNVAIIRQREVEPDPRRRMKAIELYNVLGFGWALGHDHRDSDGEHSMLFFEDLKEAARRRGDEGHAGSKLAFGKLSARGEGDGS